LHVLQQACIPRLLVAAPTRIHTNLCSQRRFVGGVALQILPVGSVLSVVCLDVAWHVHRQWLLDALASSHTQKETRTCTHTHAHMQIANRVEFQWTLVRCMKMAR
jgi:hypothetical protein